MNLFVSPSAILLLVFSCNVNASLIGRDLDGNTSTAEAYYDDVGNLTWLADANYAMTSGYDDDGLMTYDEAIAWVNLEFNVNAVGGSRDWRLAFTPNEDHHLTCNDWTLRDQCFQGEMAQLYFGDLSATAYQRPSSYEPFTNVQINGNYWSNNIFGEHLIKPGIGTPPPPTYDILTFNMESGFYRLFVETELHFAWAVHDGDIGAAVVPVPTAAWLFGSGLVGLVGLARRKKA